MRLGPDTGNDLNIWLPWDHFGGYNYLDTNILAFSHTHLVGAGVADSGWVGVMPISTNDPTAIQNMVIKSGKNHNGYSSKFSHSKETALPGYLY